MAQAKITDFFPTEKGLQDPSNYHEKEGDLLECKDQYIIHQCNCVTKYGKGLSAKMFTRFPYSNVYKFSYRRTPGTITPSGEGGERMVVAFFAQKLPGKPSQGDTEIDRIAWFQTCLDKFESYDPKSVGFPHGIGSGLANGKWKMYRNMITKWANNNPGVIVNVYQMY